MAEGWSTGEHRTLPALLRAQAEKFGDRVGVTVNGEEVTYSDLLRRSMSMANSLIEFGIERGDVVAMLSENCPEQIYLQFGTGMIGAMEVMINTAYRGEFLAHQLRDSGAKALLVEPGLLEHVLAVLPALTALRTIVVLGSLTDDLARVDGGVRALGIDALRTGDTERLTVPAKPEWSDPCTIVYTSGTTGPSKGALMSHHYMVTLGMQQARMWWRTDGDVFYACTPMFHLASKGVGVMAALTKGARCVLDDRFSVTSFWRRVREESCTATILLGSMIPMLAARAPSEEEGIDVIVALPIAADLQAPLEERWRCKFETVYGMSEAAPLVVSDTTTRLRPGSAGKVNADYFDVRIVDDDGGEVPTGEVGEIVARPRQPHVMFDGYYRNPEATLSHFRDLWFHTGDLGRVDDDGFFYFLDRKKDYLRRRGENISSFEVEMAIMRHPDVLEACVVGVASELTEEEVKAVVVVRPGSSPSVEKLLDHCIQNMPYFAVPRYIEIADDLPRTPSGKVEKYKLRADGVTADCWDREAAGIVVRRVRA
ncbi:MAG: AMP-binding protein [Acidimicrobiia bacterium]